MTSSYLIINPPLLSCIFRNSSVTTLSLFPSYRLLPSHTPFGPSAKKQKKKHIAPPIYYIQQSGQTQELTFPTFANLSRCCFCTVISSVYKYMKNGRATQGGSILGLIEVVCFFELSLTSLAASSVEVKYCRNTRLRAARMT